MAQRTFRLVFGILLCLTPSLFCADLSTATSGELLQVYSQLRAMQGSDQGAVTENVVLKRDAATFRLRSGHLTFAAPVAERVVAAVFTGDASFQLDPPTPMDQHQLSRFTKEPKLLDTFHSAVFFFTDDTWSQLQKTLEIKGGADPAEAKSGFKNVQDRFQKNFNAWWANERTGNFTMRNLPARILSDLTDPSSRGLFLADFKGERFGDLLFQISWNRPAIVLPSLASGDEVMLVHYDLAKYSEVWSSFHLAAEYASNPHPDHSLQYLHCTQETIDTDISKDNALSATASMQFSVETGAPRLLPLSLEGVLRIDSVTDDKANKLAFIQEAREVDSDPWVILSVPANPGESYTIKVSYQEDSTEESRLILQRGEALYSVVGNSWYPHFGVFDDRTIFDLRFQLPNNKYKLAATGDLVGSQEQGSILITEWRSAEPFASVGFIYGDLDQVAATTPGLTVTAYAGKRLPTGIAKAAYAKAGRDWDDEIRAEGLQPNPVALVVPTKVLADSEIRKAHADVASLLKHAAAISEQAADLFKFYYGPIPLRAMYVTQAPEGLYVQGWPTVILLPLNSLAEAGALRFLGIQLPADEDRDFHNAPALREISRQWWGGSVGPRTYRDGWLFGGLAEFSIALYIGQFRPTAWNNFWDEERSALLTKGKDGLRPVDAGPVWLNDQTRSHEFPDLPPILAHRKGAYVFQMLRTLMADPKSKNPDEGFIAMLQDFAKTYSGQNASTADFQKIVEKHMGRPMDWFFNEWVYGTEIPHYDFSYQLGDAGGGKTLLTMSLKQSEVSDSFAMEVPIFVELNKKVFQLGLIRMQGSTAQSGQFPLPFRPDRVVLDANHSILCSISQ